MLYKLDYLSFTFPVPLTGEKDNENTLGGLLLAFHDHTAHRFLGIVTNALWQWEAPVGFYRNRIVCPNTGIQLQWSGDNAFALCSLSGQAIDSLPKYFTARDLALAANGRATRADFAVDFETSVMPSEFAEKRNSPRIRTQGTFTSGTGETVYLGSRSGDRFCRVYRYNEPHPRSKYLRAEVELKGDAAKNACDLMQSLSLSEVVLSAHDYLGWTHSLWQPGELKASPLAARRHDSEGAGTLKWINDAVLPALKRAQADGLLDVRAWFDENFPG